MFDNDYDEVWLVDECWSRGFNYEEYVSWYETYCGGMPVTELVYVKACADLDLDLETNV